MDQCMYNALSWLLPCGACMTIRLLQLVFRPSLDQSNVGLYHTQQSTTRIFCEQWVCDVKTSSSVNQALQNIYTIFNFKALKFEYMTFRSRSLAQMVYDRMSILQESSRDRPCHRVTVSSQKCLSSLPCDWQTPELHTHHVALSSAI